MEGQIQQTSVFWRIWAACPAYWYCPGAVSGRQLLAKPLLKAQAALENWNLALVHGAVCLKSYCTLGDLGKRFLLFWGRRTGPKRSGAVLACFWIDFQAKQSILDLTRAILNDLGLNQHLG